MKKDRDENRNLSLATRLEEGLIEPASAPTECRGLGGEEPQPFAGPRNGQIPHTLREFEPQYWIYRTITSQYLGAIGANAKVRARL